MPYELKRLANGFDYLEVRNSIVSAKIALQGAHIFECTMKGKETLLWLSQESQFEIGTVIRGGIPICWPRFGSLDTTLPQHGFARTTVFELMNVTEIDLITTEVTFKLQDNENTRSIWNYKFELEVIFTLCDELCIELKTKNIDTKEFMITQALHTYFDVSDILNISIKNLENKPYLDALTNEKSIQNGAVEFIGEVDRIYQDVNEEIILTDIHKKISLLNTGSSSVVVWNPWINKCSRMSGMQANSYKEFVCIESANAFDDFRVIKPHETHTLRSYLKVENII